jgi:co-chaperonin GroES (HSP10)
MYLDLKLISKGEAEAINTALSSNGFPTENRILLAIPNEEQKVNGIIIPSQVKEGVPRKGVVVQIGNLSPDFESYKNISIGDIITYGLYAGKELQFNPAKLSVLGISHSEFSVLSLNEVIYIEQNK